MAGALALSDVSWRSPMCTGNYCNGSSNPEDEIIVMFAPSIKTVRLTSRLAVVGALLTVVANLAGFYNVTYRPWSDNEIPPWLNWFGIQLALAGWLIMLLGGKKWLGWGAVVLSVILLNIFWPARMHIYLSNASSESVHGSPYRISYEPFRNWRWRVTQAEGLMPGSSTFSGQRFMYKKVTAATADDAGDISIREFRCEARREVYWGPISITYARAFPENPLSPYLNLLEDSAGFNFKGCSVVTERNR